MTIFTSKKKQRRVGKSRIRLKNSNRKIEADAYHLAGFYELMKLEKFRKEEV